MASGENTAKAAMPMRTWAPLLLAAALALVVETAQAAPGDIVFEREEDLGLVPAVFPHWVHRIRYRCSTCHPAIFEMKAGANEITMESLGEGKFCGACHNGTTAFNVEFLTCARCHREPSE